MQSLLAIADPTRRRIVELLAQRDRTAGELVEEFDMSAPAISQHLNVLRDAGLITTRAVGQTVGPPAGTVNRPVRCEVTPQS